MAVCTYDNPVSMSRECWKDGKLICRYCASLLPPFAKSPIPADMFYFGANIGAWRSGQVVGSISAKPQPSADY